MTFAIDANWRFHVAISNNREAFSCTTCSQKMDSASSSPAPMEGHGVYNRSSRVQAAGLAPAIPLLERAAQTVLLSETADDPLVIADYGSSEGKNSLAPMTVAIRAIRERAGVERAISIVHTDLPGNDFSALFQTLINDPGSYLRGQPATFASAVGRSFYEQILPSNSVTLGWSSWALQWLSRTPGPIPDQVQVACSRDDRARAEYSRQSAEDWRNFLTCRSRELRPGGKLVLQMMALHDDGDFGYRPLLTALYSAITSLVSEGFISEDEMHRMAIPTVGRSRSDLLAPFSEERQLGDLAIEALDVFDAEDSIWRQFERDRDAGGFGADGPSFRELRSFRRSLSG